MCQKPGRMLGKLTLKRANFMRIKPIIHQLGGPAQVAAELGVNSQAVSHWIRDDAIPLARIPAILRLARKRGIPLRPEEVDPHTDWEAFTQ